MQDREEKVTQNNMLIFQLYLFQVLSPALQANGNNTKEKEISLLLMADWVMGNKQSHQSLKELAKRIYKVFRQANSKSPIRESCPICKVELGLSSITKETCKHGHTLGSSIDWTLT